MIISPAKSLDFSSPVSVEDFSEPEFIADAVRINHQMRDLSPAQISELMGVSHKIADLNWKRNQVFSVPFTPNNARQAVYAFNGDVYHGLDAYSLSKGQMLQLQKSLRILSGLYGVLRPLDLIQAYRLEMGTKFSVQGVKNLYEFWQGKITQYFKEELQSDEILVNLASEEYAKVIDFKQINNTIVTPIFKDWKGEKLKVISFYAKKARGLMVRYILENQIEKAEDLKGFNKAGYAYHHQESEKAGALVFVR